MKMLMPNLQGDCHCIACVSQGQFGDRSGASEGQAGAGRLPGQREEGADEGGLSGAHFGTKGQSGLLT